MKEVIDAPTKKLITKKNKPPTQMAGVSGIDGHGAMGAAPLGPRINWYRLLGLPSFEMFVFEQSGQSAGSSADEWVKTRRASLSDDVLYEQYAKWHKNKGLWVKETPMGYLIEG